MLRSSFVDRNRRNSSRWIARDCFGPGGVSMISVISAVRVRQRSIDLEREDDVDADAGAFEMLLDETGLLPALAGDLPEARRRLGRIPAVEPRGQHGLARGAEAVKRRRRDRPGAGAGSDLRREPLGVHAREQQAEPVREGSPNAVPRTRRRGLPERADHAVEQVQGEAAEGVNPGLRIVEAVHEFPQVAIVGRRRQQAVGQPVPELGKEAPMARDAGARDEVGRVRLGQQGRQRGPKPFARRAWLLDGVEQRRERCLPSSCRRPPGAPRG